MIPNVISQENDKMTHIQLSDNMLQGTIPESIFTSFTSLQELDLNFNLNLGGTLSTYIGHLTDLEYLAMYHGQLNGTIPTELGLLTNIWMFDFASNSLTGTIPTELGLMVDRLHYMYIHENLFHGSCG